MFTMKAKMRLGALFSFKTVWFFRFRKQVYSAHLVPTKKKKNSNKLTYVVCYGSVHPVDALGMALGFFFRVYTFREVSSELAEKL
jgi:hypothetical protein